MSLRILYIISGLSTGGAEVSLVEICKEAVKLGHKVKIVSLTSPSSEFVKRFDNKIEIITINLRSKKELIYSLHQIRGLIHSYNPDVIHSHMIHANLFGAFCKMFGIIKQPLFATAHSTNEGRLSILYKFFNRFFNGSIHISKAGLEIYRKKRYFRKYTSFYIPNGVAPPDIISFFGIPRSEKRFITLGRLVKLKNHTLMIDAVINAHECYPDISLSIFGTGPLFHELEYYIKSKNASSYIFMMGETEDPLRELLQSNYFLLSSDWEGMPMSLLEACSAGLPSVVTDVGSCKEIVSNLPLCFAAEQGNKEQFFSYVLELAAASSDAQRFASPIIRDRIVEKYSIEATFLALLNIYYRSLLAVRK